MDNRVVVVTGAGGYIGGEIAKTLARGGDTVVVCDLLQDNAEQTAREIREAGFAALAVRADVSDSADVDRMFDCVMHEFGRLDVLVNAAGGSARVAGKEARVRRTVVQEDFVIRGVIEVNLLGAIYTSRAAARLMIENGCRGHIVLISSVAGVSGLDSYAEYSASKGGVIAFSKAFAKEVGEYGINVNTVAPGCVGNLSVPDDAPNMIQTNFLCRRGNAADIANSVEFLASDRASFVTGQTLTVDGGRSIAVKGTD